MGRKVPEKAFLYISHISLKKKKTSLWYPSISFPFCQGPENIPAQTHPGTSTRDNRSSGSAWVEVGVGSDFSPKGTFGNTWRQFLITQAGSGGKGLLIASSGHRTPHIGGPQMSVPCRRTLVRRGLMATRWVTGQHSTEQGSLWSCAPHAWSGDLCSRGTPFPSFGRARPRELGTRCF